MLADLLQLTPIQIILCIMIIFFAYAVKGLSGFGSGLIAIPLLAFIFPLTLIVPVLGLLSYSGTLMQSIQLRKHVSWHDMLPLIPFSMLGIFIAIWLLVNLDADILVLALGVSSCCMRSTPCCHCRFTPVDDNGRSLLAVVAAWWVHCLAPAGRSMCCT